MIFKRSKGPSLLEQAAEVLGVSADRAGLQGEVDGVPVVVTHPITPNPSTPGGLWILVGPTARNWITNTIPDEDTRPVEHVDTEQYVGDAAPWLGLDVTTKRAAGDLSADDLAATVRQAVAQLSALG